MSAAANLAKRKSMLNQVTLAPPVAAVFNKHREKVVILFENEVDMTDEKKKAEYEADAEHRVFVVVNEKGEIVWQSKR